MAPRRAYYGETLCRKRAERALAGLGDPELGEWREWSGTAYHLRRRLTSVEQSSVGPTADVRGTPEARRRAAELGKVLRFVPPEVLEEEIGARTL